MRTSAGRGFHPWLAASTASVFGDSVTFFAIGWVAAGFGADAASLVLTIEGIPLAVLVLAGGVLADRIGIRRAMAACDAATFALVLVALVAIRPPHEPAPGPDQGSVWRSLADGARTAARTPGVVPVLVAITGLAATVLPLVMLALPLAGRERGWTAAETGLVSGAWVAGGLVMTLGVARWGAPRAAVAVAGPALAAGGVVLLALRTEVWAGILAIGLVGVGTTMLTSYLFPAYVARTPPEMLARFSSLTQLAQTGPVLLATPLLGVAAGADVRLALAVIAALLLATVPTAARVARPPRPIP